MDRGRVVRGAEHPGRRARRVAQHAAARRDPPDRPVVVDHPVVGLVVAAGVDRLRDRRLRARQVRGVQADGERVDVRREGLGRVAEQLLEPVVEVQRVRAQVPVEAADVRRREPEREPGGAVLQLRGERAAFELARDRRRELAQQLTVVLGPRELLLVVDAEDADAVVRRLDRRAEIGAGCPPVAGAARPWNVASASASAGGRRGVGGVSWTWTSVKSDTCAYAVPSSRALSAASRSIASPGASVSRRRAASARCGSASISASILTRRRDCGAYCSARRAASASGSAPTRRSNGPTTAQTAFRRSRAPASTGCTRASDHSSDWPSPRSRTPCANATRTVPGSSHAANASGPSSAG